MKFRITKENSDDLSDIWDMCSSGLNKELIFYYPQARIFGRWKYFTYPWLVGSEIDHKAYKFNTIKEAKEFIENHKNKDNLKNNKIKEVVYNE
jgi:hypothetical protein